MLKVVCFGEAFIDLLSNSIEPPVSANNNESFKKFPGGAPANVAVVVSKLGGTSYFVGKLATFITFLSLLSHFYHDKLRFMSYFWIELTSCCSPVSV